SGLDRGKLAAAGGAHRAALGDVSWDGLFTAMRSADGWTRDTAFRLLTERPDLVLPRTPATNPSTHPSTHPSTEPWAQPPPTTLVAALHLAADLGEGSDLLLF